MSFDWSRTAVRIPELYCPICGQRRHDGHCSERTYRGIDAALSQEDRAPRTPGYNERLRYGMRLLGEE